jgi:uncharacterized damage-inducible protein DinB
MATAADTFTRYSVSLLSEDYLTKLTRSLAPLTDDDVWWRPNEASNSIGNLLLHLRGNVTQWIIGGVGQRPFERVRDAEFAARSGAGGPALLNGLAVTVHDACGVIAAQTLTSLTERRQIQGYDVSVLEAIYHVVEHFAMHTGQIILLAKSRTAVDLELWRPPVRP